MLLKYVIKDLHLVDENFDSLTISCNHVFSDIGGLSQGLFDWGLPFYFGRNIFVGLKERRPALAPDPTLLPNGEMGTSTCDTMLLPVKATIAIIGN